MAAFEKSGYVFHLYDGYTVVRVTSTFLSSRTRAATGGGDTNCSKVKVNDPAA